MGGITLHLDNHPEKNFQMPDAIESSPDLTPRLRLLYPTSLQNGTEMLQGSKVIDGVKWVSILK